MTRILGDWRGLIDADWADCGVSAQINWEQRWLQASFADIVRRDVDKTRMRAQIARIARHQQAAFAVMAAATWWFLGLDRISAVAVPG